MPWCSMLSPCSQLAGCPDCGVIAQGHGACGGGGDRRALGRESVRIRWHKRRWICRNIPASHGFRRQNHSVCAPGRVWVFGRSAGRSDSCASRPLSRGWPPVRNQVEYRVVPYQAVSPPACIWWPARFSGVQVLGLTSTCGTAGPATRP